jgi:hypothetical protein
MFHVKHSIKIHPEKSKKIEHGTNPLTANTNIKSTAKRGNELEENVSRETILKLFLKQSHHSQEEVRQASYNNVSRETLSRITRLRNSTKKSVDTSCETSIDSPNRQNH